MRSMSRNRNKSQDSRDRSRTERGRSTERRSGLKKKARNKTRIVQDVNVKTVKK